MFQDSTGAEHQAVPSVHQDNTQNENPKGCEMDGKRHTIQMEEIKIQRSIWDHDGVIDMLIETLDDDSPENSENSSTRNVEAFTIRITTLLQNPDFLHLDAGRYRIQDFQSRLSILISSSSVQNSAALEHVLVQPKHMDSKQVFTISLQNRSAVLPLKMRFILEDVDNFHPGANVTENYFGNLMAEDFYNPLEIFVAV